MSQKALSLFLLLSGLFILILSGVVFAANGESLNRDEGPAQEIPQPQGFCGYCHILTFPDIFNKAQNTWKKSKHNTVGCVECHYPPRPFTEEDQGDLSDEKSMATHIPLVSPGHFSSIELGGETIKTKPPISNASCTTAACHGNPDDDFKTRKIKFTEKVTFVHEPHFLKENQIDGMQMNCTTCHQHNTDANHFEVRQATCNLCHFANTKFNEGRSRCELCHTLPTKPIKVLEGVETKDITHEKLKESGVTCSSCHFDLIQSAGETKIVPFFEGGVLKTTLLIGAGRFKNESCLNCHDQVEYLKDAKDKKLMHQDHVASKNARCFDCHQPIKHAKADLPEPLTLDCSACHESPHRYQRLLAAGAAREGIESVPDPMFKARVNCLGCHIEKEVDHMGQTVMKASSRSCARCHNSDYEQMFGLWTREVSGELDKALRLEKEAADAFDKYKPNLARDKLDTADAMLRAGRENLGIVRFGNGIHNSKYAIELLDSAMTNFKDMIAIVEGKDLSEDYRQEE
jgi:nitrate/TMAO reductase-like tetraheme cytochrome c subunit